MNLNSFAMRLFVILLCIVSTAFAQIGRGGFGGFGGGGGGGGGFDLGGAINSGVGQLTDAASSITSQFQSIPVLNNVQDFADFAAQTGRTYLDAADKALREGLFDARKNLVDANNAAFAAGTSTFKTAINAFADITSEEFLNFFTGNKKSAAGEASASQNRKEAAIDKNAALPDSFDWRDLGGVNPPIHQGECGSCWAFAVAGAIEGHTFKKTGTLPKLSQQNLVDCGPEDIGLFGCGGGYQEYGFNFVVQQKGIANFGSYPYELKQGTCSYKDEHKEVEITGFAVVKEKDEEKMKAIVAKYGPLACSIYAKEDSLLMYSSGIYNDDECNHGDLNHAVLVVGYGSENGQDYWIVRNSWGDTWGEGGFFKLPRGSNFCGISDECSFPVF